MPQHVQRTDGRTLRRPAMATQLIALLLSGGNTPRVLTTPAREGTTMPLTPAMQTASSVSQENAGSLPANSVGKFRLSAEDIYLAIMVGVGLTCWLAAVFVLLTANMAW